MTSLNRKVWTELPIYEKNDVCFANGLAALSVGGARGLLVDQISEPLFLSPDRVLQKYSLYLCFSSLQGDLKVGLEVGALFPQFSIELIKPTTETQTLLTLVEWLTCEWVDCLEGLIGLQLTLVSVQTDSPCEPRAHGILVSSHDRRNAHLAVSGELLAYLHWPAARQELCRIPLLMGLSVSVQVLVCLSKVTPEEIGKLERGSFLVISLEQPKLIVIAAGKKQLQVRKAFLNGENSMSNPYESYVDEEFSVSQDEGALPAIEQLSMNVDVVLETLSMSLSELSIMSRGQFLMLGQSSIGRVVQLRCQGRRLAMGEVVAIEDKLAILITATDLQAASKSV